MELFPTGRGWTTSSPHCCFKYAFLSNCVKSLARSPFKCQMFLKSKFESCSCKFVPYSSKNEWSAIILLFVCLLTLVWLPNSLLVILGGLQRLKAQQLKKTIIPLSPGDNNQIISLIDIFFLSFSICLGLPYMEAIPFFPPWEIEVSSVRCD